MNKRERENRSSLLYFIYTVVFEYYIKFALSTTVVCLRVAKRRRKGSRCKLGRFVDGNGSNVAGVVV